MFNFYTSSSSLSRLPPCFANLLVSSFNRTIRSSASSVSLSPSLLLDEDDEVFSFSEYSERLGWRMAVSYKSCRPFAFNFSSHFLLIFGLPRRVALYTASNLGVVQKFCVTATVCVMFNTACHHPSGTNIISPAFCTTSKLFGHPPTSDHSRVCVIGYAFWNHVTDSPSNPIPFGFRRGFYKPLSGGYNTQRFCPEINAFQADVANGSTCTEDPLLCGPNTTHLCGGLRLCPTYLNKSSEK